MAVSHETVSSGFVVSDFRASKESKTESTSFYTDRTNLTVFEVPSDIFLFFHGLF